MKLVWKITSSDIRYVKDFVDLYRDDDFVKRRIKLNIERDPPHISKEKVWNVLVSCLLTTQQRSGPESYVSKFLELKPFPLSYKTCQSKPDVERYSYQTLSDSKGIRRTKSIASEIATNIMRFEKKLWSKTLSELKSLQKETNPDLEKKVADYLLENFKGIGQKQSRNFLQELGLSHYEIPIDTRITKWLNNFGFPVVLSATALGDRNYYNFISDGIQKLCVACDIYPCVFDAAIFASYDRK